MAVMATGVHLAVMTGTVIESVMLLHRQRIHIGTETDGFPATPCPQYTHYPGAGQAAVHLDPQPLQGIRDEIASPVFLEGKFRVGVNVSPD